MSEYEVPDPHRRWLYWGAIAILVVVVVIALFAFGSARSTREAREKADQLIASLEDAGVHAPSLDQIVRVRGSDGGAVCEDPADALRRATLLAQMTNGATGPGQRPVIVDRRIVHGELLIIQTYCPDELEDIQDKVDELDFEQVIRG